MHIDLLEYDPKKSQSQFLNFWFLHSAYFLATILFVPAAVMMIGAGFIFTRSFGIGTGIVLATLSSFFGAVLSAIVSFFIARFILRTAVKRTTKRYALLRALDAAVQQNGLKICVLIRLSPLIPFNAINYIAGGSSVKFREYTLALIAMIPGIVLGVVVGASMSSLTDASSAGNPTITIVVSVLGTLFSIIAMYIVTIYTKKQLNQAATEDRLEYDAGEAAERLTESDVVDVIVEAMHDMQVHAIVGDVHYNNERQQHQFDQVVELVSDEEDVVPTSAIATTTFIS
jgi:uncharacterized membrane protein YdjX (TVP38/TMEM64 family)